MTERGVKALPICEGERLVGIVTDWDLAKAVAGGEDLDAAEGRERDEHRPRARPPRTRRSRTRPS